MTELTAILKEVLWTFLEGARTARIRVWSWKKTTLKGLNFNRV